MYDIPIKLNWLEDQIKQYEEQPVETGKILFYGHSLFTRWSIRKHTERTLQEMILGKDGKPACVNHGFGTSTSEELLYYYDRMVRPYKPRVLVMMTWANDSMYGYSPERCIENIEKLCAWARMDFPGIPIFLVESHPHGRYKEQPSDQAMRLERTFCTLLKAYANSQEGIRVITMMDKPMFYETPEDVGDFTKIRRDIFEDSIHLNGTGYELFKDIFIEALDEYL